MRAPEQSWSAARPLALGFLTLVLLVGGLAVWSVFTTISGAVIAPGRIEVSQSRQVVQHLDGGVVEAILVTDGAKVAVGDVLLRLDGATLRSDWAIIEAQLLELAARRSRLEALRDEAAVLSFPDKLVAAAATRPDVAEMLEGEAGLFARQVDTLIQARDMRQTRIAQIRSQMTGLDAQEWAIQAQIAPLEAQLSSLRDLVKRGLTPAMRVLELDQELARLMGQRGELASTRAEAAGRIAEIGIEIAAILTQSRERAEAELREVAARQLVLSERARALADRIARLEVRAPVSGIVLGQAVTTPQSVIRPAETLMVIVPQDRPLLVAARVPLAHVDEVRPGQIVRLVFSSLSTRSTPEITGTVTHVSADALTDDRTGQAYFRAEIAITKTALRNLAGVQMLPGMPVDAFFRTEDRTPLSYFLQPFTDYFRTAFRET